MPLQKVPPLSLSEIRAQYGAPIGTPLSAFHAGGAYVPAGTTNGSNVPIASSGPLNISDFLGSPNGIQLSDYYANVAYYFRYIEAPGPGPAQSPNYSGNASGNYSVPTNGGRYSNIFFQNYAYSNSNLKTAPGCTVVYTLAGEQTNYNGCLGARPGGSAAGAIQVSAGYQGFYVWTEGNRHLLAPVKLQVDYKSSSNDVITVIAWYACSPTAITKVTAAWDSGGVSKHSAQYPAVIIMPGWWTANLTPWGGAAITYSLAANTWAWVVSSRDGDGNYGIPYQAVSPTSAYLEYQDHWYHNSTFLILINSSTATIGPSTLPAPGSNEAGCVYQFYQDSAGAYTGPNIPNGSSIQGFGAAIVNAMTPYVKSGSTSRQATVFFLPSGGAYGSGDGGTTIQSFDNTSFGGNADVVPAWWAGATMIGTPPGNSHWIRATVLSNSQELLGTWGTQASTNPAALYLVPDQWTPLDVTKRIDYVYTQDSGSATAVVRFDIATDVNGSNAVTIGTVTFVVVNGATTSGGGGGGCVGASMMLDPTRVAASVRVGDTVNTVDPTILSYTDRQVISELISLEPTWRMTTVSGIELDASDSTPMTLKDGTTKMFGPEMEGELVLVDDQGTVRWEEVKSMVFLDHQVVVRMDLGGYTFFAGTRGDRRIATHNVTK